MRSGEDIVPSGVSEDAADQSLSTQISGSEKGSLIGAWVGTIVCCVILGAFLFFGKMPWFIDEIPDPIPWILAAVVAVSLGKAIWETIRLKRFGDPILALNIGPVPVDSTLEGRINLGPAYSNGPEFSIKLQCLHCHERGGGKGSHMVEEVLWSAGNKVSLMPGGIVPISIALPKDQPETNDENPFDSILWRLTVTAPFKGIGFCEKYEIPVRSGSQGVIAKPT